MMRLTLMAFRCSLQACLGILIFLSQPAPVMASLATGPLSAERAQGVGTFSQDAAAFLNAMAYPLLQPQTHSKIQGPFRPFAEVGFGMTSVDSARLSSFTTEQSSPTAFQSVYAKGGIGLPFGFGFEGGVSKVTSREPEAAYYGTLSFQVLDFATLVFTDMVPSLSMNGSILRSFQGPGFTDYAGTVCLGAYNRKSLLQFGYIFRIDEAVLSEIPGVSKLLKEHGGMISLPIWKGLNIRTDVFFPTLSGILSVGYRF